MYQVKKKTNLHGGLTPIQGSLERLCLSHGMLVCRIRYAEKWGDEWMWRVRAEEPGEPVAYPEKDCVHGVLEEQGITSELRRISDVKFEVWTVLVRPPGALGMLLTS